MDIFGHTALVTGGALRLGAAVCRRLAQEGCRVVIHCRHSSDAAGALCADLQAMNAEAFVVQGVLDEAGAAERIMAAAWEAAGTVDILINNAAVYERGTLLETDEELFLRHIRVNTLAPLMLMRALMARVRCGSGGDAKAARIINLLDRRVAGTATGCMAYHLSKCALAEATRSAALELAPYAVVNAVAPGPVLPPPAGGVIGEKAGTVPLGERPVADAVADAVALLLRADSVTGQILYVDGGQHLLGRWENE